MRKRILATVVALGLCFSACASENKTEGDSQMSNVSETVAGADSAEESEETEETEADLTAWIEKDLGEVKCPYTAKASDEETSAYVTLDTNFNFPMREMLDELMANEYYREHYDFTYTEEDSYCFESYSGDNGNFSNSPRLFKTINLQSKTNDEFLEIRAVVDYFFGTEPTDVSFIADGYWDIGKMQEDLYNLMSLFVDKNLAEYAVYQKHTSEDGQFFCMLKQEDFSKFYFDLERNKIIDSYMVEGKRIDIRLHMECESYDSYKRRYLDTDFMADNYKYNLSTLFDGRIPDFNMHQSSVMEDALPEYKEVGFPFLCDDYCIVPNSFQSFTVKEDFSEGTTKYSADLAYAVRMDNPVNETDRIPYIHIYYEIIEKDNEIGEIWVELFAKDRSKQFNLEDLPEMFVKEASIYFADSFDVVEEIGEDGMATTEEVPEFKKTILGKECTGHMGTYVDGSFILKFGYNHDEFGGY